MEILDVGELFSFVDDTPFGVVLLVIVAVGVILLFTGFFAFVVEVVVLAIALAVTLAAKFLFRRPWFVEAVATGDSSTRRRWAVVGWKRSGEIIDEVARSLEAGSRFISPHARELEGANQVGT